MPITKKWEKSATGTALRELVVALRGAATGAALSALVRDEAQRLLLRPAATWFMGRPSVRYDALLYQMCRPGDPLDNPGAFASSHLIQFTGLMRLTSPQAREKALSNYLALRGRPPAATLIWLTPGTQGIFQEQAPEVWSRRCGVYDLRGARARGPAWVYAQAAAPTHA